MNREKDELVNNVLLQCAFNDFVRNKRKATQAFDNTQHCIQLFREIFHNAVVLVGEILPHPNDQQANNGIRAARYLMEEMYTTFDDVVRFVPHQICRSDDKIYHQDRIHLNETLGTPQMWKDFHIVSQNRMLFATRKKPTKS